MGRGGEPRLPGRVFVLSGPSGVGKGSLVRALLERDPSLHYSVSVTTRPPRPGEIHGRDYLFVTPERFDELLREEAFLEWAEVFGHRYGTLAEPLLEAGRQGRDSLLELDMQGAASIRARVRDAVLLFIAPPSREELMRRIRGRGTEVGRELDRRLVQAEDELAQAARFDHVVQNDHLKEAVAEVAAIIERYRREDQRQTAR